VVGGIRHGRRVSRLEHIVIWQDGDKNLHVKVKKNGVWSPDGTELDITFNDSGHVTDGWRDCLEVGVMGNSKSMKANDLQAEGR